MARYFIIMFVMCVLQLRVYAQRETNFTEQSFKAELLKSGYDNLEGIYEETQTLTKYGIVKDKSYDRYVAVYLSSGSQHISTYWKSGTVKGYLYKTATENLLRVEWFMFSMDSDKEDYYMKYTGWGLEEMKMWADAVNKSYIKHFPNSSPSSNKPSTSSGTGFAISSNGIIVTNYHVIQGASNITVKGINADPVKGYKAKVLISDQTNDLCIIQVIDKEFTTLGQIPYTIKTKTAEVGEEVFVLGYPLRSSMGDEIKLTTGVISSKTGINGAVTDYQFSAPVQPGNSGGPLFDKQGNVIGIVSAKHKQADNASYAIKANYLLNLYDLLPAQPKQPVVNTLSGKPLVAQVQLAKKFVYVIECE